VTTGAGGSLGETRWRWSAAMAAFVRLQ